jgi:hypothetical protein
MPWRQALVDLLASARRAQPDELPVVVNRAVAPLGLAMTIHLVDQEQRTLHALLEPGKPAPPPLAVDSTEPGRAFMYVRPARTDPDRLWLPLLDDTERLGVLEVVAERPDRLDDAGFQGECELFGELVGHLVALKTPYADRLVCVRRTQRMSEASELLWKLLPPLTFACHRMVISAVLEPAYNVGGDGFDYAVDGGRAYLLVLDTVGHGLRAGLGTAVALSAMRASRRDGDGLYEMARAADAALIQQMPDDRFVTAVLAQLDLDSGRLRYINAGHPPPLVLRNGKVVHRLDAGRRLPLGLDDPALDIADETLEPGDRLLLFTDGVTEAQDQRGEPFGEQRLIELLERHATDELPAPETLRRLCHAALAHYGGPPADDATLLLVEWSRAAADRVVTA